MTEPRHYIRDGAEIYRNSFAIIRAEADLSRFNEIEEKVAVRIIHACGMTDVVSDIEMAPSFANAARAALLRGARLYVGPDTSVTHLAAASGCPTLALFGPTDPALSAPLGRVAIVRHAVPCAPCFYRACPIDHPCMRGISADEVGDRVAALLAGVS